MLTEHTLYIALALLGIGCVVAIIMLLGAISLATIDDDDEPMGFEAGDPTDTITAGEEDHRVT